MDIWKWVEETQEELANQGHNRLAFLIDEIPNQILKKNYDQVDAMLPEALSLSKELNNSWLQIFFRHWNLQGQDRS